VHHEFLLFPNGKWAGSTNLVGGNRRTVFDVEAQTVARTINLPVLPVPYGIRFLGDSERVLFTSGSSQGVGIANVQTGEIIASIETGQQTTHMLVIDALESKAFTTNIRSHSISVIDLVAGEKLKDIATEKMPEAINYDALTNELWYGANQDGKLLVIKPDTEEVLATWGGFKFPYRILFNHDKSLVLVPDFRNHYVRFFDVKTKREIGSLALEEQAGPQGIIMHPTKNIAFLSLNLKNKIVAIDIASRTVIAEYPTGNNPDGLIYVP